MANKVLTFLDHAGNVLKEILHIGSEVALAAEPIVDTAFPALAPLYNSTVGLAMGAQAMAPTPSGTGPQKLAQLVASLLPQATQWAAANGITWPEAEIQTWASAVVDTINLIPAPAGTTVVAAPPEAPAA